MATPSITQHTTKATGSASSVALAFGSAVTSGDLLVAVARCGNLPNTLSCSDSVNGSWGSPVVSEALNIDGDQCAIFLFKGSAAGTPTVTVSASAAGSWTLALVDWAPGAGNTWSAPAQTNSANSTGTTANSGNITTTSADALIVAGCAFDGDVSGNNGCAGTGSTTLIDAVQNSGGNLAVASGYQLVTSTGSYAAEFSVTTSQEYAAMVVAVPYTSGGGGPTIHTLMMMGMGN